MIWWGRWMSIFLARRGCVGKWELSFSIEKYKVSCR